MVDGIQPSGAKIQTPPNVRGFKWLVEDILDLNALTKAIEFKLEKETMPSTFEDRDALGLPCWTLAIPANQVVVGSYRSQVYSSLWMSNMGRTAEEGQF